MRSLFVAFEYMLIIEVTSDNNNKIIIYLNIKVKILKLIFK